MLKFLDEQKYDEVKEYYGKVLRQSSDLKTNACCTPDDLSEEVKKLISEVHEEVVAQYYGCGLVLPPLLEGMKILDLGSGSGRDAFILSKLVGADGYVVGVDMTDEQLEVANRHIDYHTERYGYRQLNIEFRKGYIEHLQDLGFEDQYFDLVVSNCVVNLSPDKRSVLREVKRVLKPGGEFYFSDVYSDRRIPQSLVENPTLYGECLSGALYWNDFMRLARETGFQDPRVVSARPLTIENAEVQNLVGNIRFQSMTYRLFQIDSLEDACEDFGQAVIYQGTIPGSPYFFDLDEGHQFEKGRSVLVCGNTYLMLKESRFSSHFEYFGNMSTHLGIFPDCGQSTNEIPETENSISCC